MFKDEKMYLLNINKIAIYEEDLDNKSIELLVDFGFNELELNNRIRQIQGNLDLPYLLLDMSNKKIINNTNFELNVCFLTEGNQVIKDCIEIINRNNNFIFFDSSAYKMFNIARQLYITEFKDSIIQTKAYDRD